MILFACGLAGSTRVEVAMFEAGKPVTSAPSKALSGHGYYGVEARAIDRISGFICGLE